MCSSLLTWSMSWRVSWGLCVGVLCSFLWFGPTKLQPTKNFLRHPYTAPTTPDVHYNSIYNARHLMPNTQIMANLPITFSIFTAPNTIGSDHLYNTLELLMMDIMVPETCWASNKICNKYHLLHLGGILFPHINDDARSESLQIYLLLCLISIQLTQILISSHFPCSLFYHYSIHPS